MVLTMELQQATQFLNQHLKTFRGKELSVAEQVALKAAWLDIRYDEASADFIDISPNYLSSRVAPELWKTLSDCFDQPLKKKNIRRFLEMQSLPPFPQDVPTPSLPEFNQKILPLVGRESELHNLSELVSHHQCINICGESGVGKSHLVRHLLQDSRWTRTFDQVVWSSVCHAPKLETLCHTLLQDLGRTIDGTLDDVDLLMYHLFEVLKSKRYLLVLDSADMWITHQINVDSFLRRTCEETIRSVILILSRSPFPILSALQTKRYPCRIFRLEGLTPQDAFKILDSYNLEDPESWPQLVQKYRGNPLALMQAAEMILDLFEGQVKRFIDLETTVVFDTFTEAYRSYSFSTDEISLLQVVRDLKQAKISDIISACDQSHSKVIALLNTLLAHSFLDRHMRQNGYVYSVPPMLNKFLTQQFAVAGES